MGTTSSSIPCTAAQAQVQQLELQRRPPAPPMLEALPGPRLQGKAAMALTPPLCPPPALLLQGGSNAQTPRPVDWADGAVPKVAHAAVQVPVPQ